MILNDELIHTKVTMARCAPVQRHHDEIIEYLSFKKLTELGVINAFSLKGLNFRNNEYVHEEYKKFLDVLNIKYEYLVRPQARHTDNVITVNKKVNDNSADIYLEYLDGVDGVITDKPNIAIATTSADCLCMIMYDKNKKVLANVHSGWRGTFKKISQKALIKMKEEFDCNPHDILVFLMPAIRQCHFEVDIDVMEECRNIFSYTNRLNEIIKLGRKVDGLQKYNIDNILINKILLENEGVLEENIFDSELCSVCNSDVIHSRRADGENFNIAATIAMRCEK